MYFEFEFSIIHFLQNLLPMFDWFLHAVTDLGYGQFYYFCGAIIFWSFSRRLGFRLLFLSALSWGVNSLFKMMFHAPRPFWVDQSVFSGTSHGGYGMPSGHAQSAVVFWGILGHAERRGWIWAGCLFMVFSIGISRVYLGVHFPGQVLMAWGIGLILVILYLRFEARFLSWYRESGTIPTILIPLLVSGIIIGIGILIRWVFRDWTTPGLWIETAPKTFSSWRVANPFSIFTPIVAAAQVGGLLLGYAVGGHQEVRWEMKRWKSALLKMGLGILVLSGIYFGAKYRITVPDDWYFLVLWWRYIGSFASGFWITGGATLLFRKLGLE